MYYVLGIWNTYIPRYGFQEDHRDHNAQKYNKEYGIDQIEPV